MTPTLTAAIATFKETGDAAPLTALMPFAGFIGLQTRIDDSGQISVLSARPGIVGNTQLGAVHGGVIGALLEHAAIMQLFHQLVPEHTPKTINISIDYLRPCLADRDTVAKATVIKQGRRIANVRVVAHQDSPDRPIAAAHAHFLIG